MPTICSIRGIQIFINWREHLPPHFHAKYAGHEVSIEIETLEPMNTGFPSR